MEGCDQLWEVCDLDALGDGCADAAAQRRYARHLRQHRRRRNQLADGGSDAAAHADLGATGGAGG